MLDRLQETQLLRDGAVELEHNEVRPDRFDRGQSVARIANADFTEPFALLE